MDNILIEQCADIIYKKQPEIEKNIYRMLQIIDSSNELLEIKGMIGVYKYTALENIKKYNKLYDCYNNILDNCIKLIKELGLKDSLEISNFFTYLIWNGYFSIYKNFKYQLKNRLSLRGLETLDIMDGRGVCVEISSMHKDLLKKIGVPAAVISNCLSVNFCNYHPNIKMNIDISKLEKISMKLHQNKTNHASTLIKDAKGLYVYDPTNALLANLENKNLAVIETGDGKCRIDIVDTKRCCLNNQELKLVEYLENISLFNYPYSRRDFIVSFEDTISLANDNIVLLDSYYDEVRESINFISNNVKILKQKK